MRIQEQEEELRASALLVSLKFVAEVRRSSLRVLKMSSVKKVANGEDASSDGGGVISPVASGSRQLQMTDMFKPRLTPSQEKEQIGEKNKKRMWADEEEDEEEEVGLAGTRHKDLESLMFSQPWWDDAVDMVQIFETVEDEAIMPEEELLASLADESKSCNR
jgi:hypothetical protein